MVIDCTLLRLLCLLCLPACDGMLHYFRGQKRMPAFSVAFSMK
jgi:hypothetical protein